MAIPRIKRRFPLLGYCWLIYAAAVPRPAVAQVGDSSVKLTREAQPVFAPSRSPSQILENQEPPNAAEGATREPCTLHGFVHDTWTEASQFGHGLRRVPRGVVRPSNLKWELPTLAATGVLIAKVDRPADNRIQFKSLQQTADLWSNVGVGLEIGSGALAYGIGCDKHHPYLRDTGFKALAAMAAAGTVDLALKLAFDRQFPGPNSTGKFWGGGRSFPSGHSATSFAFAAAIAHRYPHKRWLKWSGYALATGVSFSRYPAKRHFPSDILMGATIGYVSGIYLAEH